MNIAKQIYGKLSFNGFVIKWKTLNGVEELFTVLTLEDADHMALILDVDFPTVETIVEYYARHGVTIQVITDNNDRLLYSAKDID